MNFIMKMEILLNEIKAYSIKNDELKKYNFKR